MVSSLAGKRYPFSNSSSLSLSFTVPSGPPQLFYGSATSPYVVSINWQPPVFTEQNGVITGYVVNITSLDTAVTWQLTTTNTTTLQIPNLTPYTNYVCIIAARTAIGVGPFSTVLDIQTLEDGE